VLRPPPVQPNATAVFFLSLSISTSVVITLVDLINDEYMLLRYMGAELFLTGKISCCIILLAVLLGAQYRAPHSY
jgi:hypothetical protein